LESWWEFAESTGYEGIDPYYRLECAFCKQRGHFEVVHHRDKQEPNGRKLLNFDLAVCTDCSAPTPVFWSATAIGGMHDSRQPPWPLGRKPTPSKTWAAQVGNYWVQAKDNLARANYEAAIMLARTSLQCVARHKCATGKNLKEEIDDLATKADLPESPHVVFVFG
jgi:hypothetical protein